MDPVWQTPVMANQIAISACFSDYSRFVDQCRGQWAETKIQFLIRPRTDAHGPPSKDGHPLVSAFNPSVGTKDQCMEDYEEHPRFGDCLERALGDQFVATVEAHEPVSLVFSNTKPSQGVISY